MARINSIIDAILFYLLATALTVVVGICFVQVMARYIFNASFTWAEEVSIVILLWATWGAACLALKQGIHLRVRILEDRLTLRKTIILRISLHSLAIIFLAFIALASRIVFDAMAYMSLMSLPSIPMNVMYACVPAGCILMIYYLLRSMVGDFKNLRALSQKER